MTPPDAPAGRIPPDDTDDTRTRTDLAVRWITWHSLELSTVAAPLILAVTVDAWLALGSVVAGVVWTATEWRRHTERRDLRALTGATTTTRQLTAAPASSPDRRDETKGAHA